MLLQVGEVLALLECGEEAGVRTLRPQGGVVLPLGSSGWGCEAAASAGSWLLILLKLWLRCCGLAWGGGGAIAAGLGAT